jgi:sulfur-carrier protein
MRIDLKLYASLSRHMPGQIGVSETFLEVEEGSTVRSLLEGLQVPVYAVKLVFVNGVHAGLGEVLKEGDRVGVFPPVAGG